MKASLALIAAGLVLAGCGGDPHRFVAWRDYGRVAECYAAFMSVSMDAKDPGLGFAQDQVALQEAATMRGVNRMTDLIRQSEHSAGGSAKFLRLVASWRLRPENDIKLAPTVEAKKRIYQHVLSEASRCHETLNGWSVQPPAGAKAAPTT